MRCAARQDRRATVRHRRSSSALARSRFGGETIGALACRWSAGATVDRERAAAVCSAAALAAAASLRGLADRAPAPAPDAAWDDLLGHSPPDGRSAATPSRAPRGRRSRSSSIGESGSGKELVARAIHRLGPRRHRRLCTINCAALSDDLLEAELFGHTRGAFTGAVTRARAGSSRKPTAARCSSTKSGSCRARAQAKLLRVLQDGEVRRVGENLPRRVDVARRRRHQPIARAGGRGGPLPGRPALPARRDPASRVPPLRERRDDIPALVAHFWDDAAARVGSRATLAPETVAALTRYDWPGNVRELQNVVASLAVHGPRRGRDHAGDRCRAMLARDGGASATSFEAAREEFERRFVRAALARAGGSGPGPRERWAYPAGPREDAAPAADSMLDTSTS